MWESICARWDTMVQGKHGNDRLRVPVCAVRGNTLQADLNPDFTHDDNSMNSLTLAATNIDIPRSTSRRNVIPKGEESVNGMLLGLCGHGGVVEITLRTRASPRLTGFRCRYVRELYPEFLTRAN